MTKRELKQAKREARKQQASYSIRYGIYTALRYVFVGFILVSVVNLVFTYLFYTPKMYNIGRDNAELVVKYRILDEKIRAASRAVDELKHRDNAVYRSLFGADTLAIDGIYADYPDTKYADLADDHFAPLMTDSWRHLDLLGRRIYLQSLSLDELQTLARDKEQMASAIPAIIPIDIKNFSGINSPFGMRFHPLYKRNIPHKGIDLPGRKGDPIYAAGDGYVDYVNSAGTGRRGYGRNLVIDHGFGYETRYGHLSKILVTPGQWVKRGELIAEMGNTGGTDGTHLHYEVLYHGIPVNPISYFKRDMDPAEFEKIIESANDSAIFENEYGTNVGE
jgi:murein DD-endopeptidase MepM/ murein hydrolase activator NlpD